MNRSIKQALMLAFMPMCMAAVLLAQEPAGKTQVTGLYDFLCGLPADSVTYRKPSEPFSEEYQVMLRQPLDHSVDSSAVFSQRIFVSFVDSAAPVVLVTEGYACGHNYLRELSELLGANQIRVEYRFYGESRPDSIPWDFLNYFQSSRDYHTIVTMFSTYFTGKWVSTGWSKGGQTALVYRRFFPDDVAATVAYDAPVNLSLTEKRIDEFFKSAGSAETREKLITFQRLVMKNKTRILPLYKEYAEQRGYSFTRITREKSLEYAVLEYPFSFWQYHKIPAAEIPDSTATADEMFSHLKKIVSMGSYTDRAFDSISMRQFSTELGYYGYVTENVSGFLSEPEDTYTNYAFAPSWLHNEYNPEFMKDINAWLLEHGHRIIYVYGENDPWSAPRITIPESIDACMVFVPRGNHFSFIRTLPHGKQESVLEKIKGWLAE